MVNIKEASHGYIAALESDHFQVPKEHVDILLANEAIGEKDPMNRAQALTDLVKRDMLVMAI